MWMRTLVNYQYKNGGTFMEAFYALYADGGTGARARATAPTDWPTPPAFVSFARTTRPARKLVPC